MNRESLFYPRAENPGLGLLLLVLSGLSIMLSPGCGGTKSAPTAIAFAQGQMAPPTSVVQGSTVQFAAVVSNDPANLGVSWLLTSCSSLTTPPTALPAAECGSITRHTASGVPTTFVAPSLVPSVGLTVMVEANASADPAQGLTQQITITPGPISVAFSPTTPTSIPAGTDHAISVIVTNDQLGPTGQPEGAALSVSACSIPGVDACGYFSGSEFITPATVPLTGVAATIEAISVANPAATATTAINVTYPTVTVLFVQLPPTSMVAGAAATMAASVEGGGQGNPASLDGVDWSCSPAPCGFFYPAHTNNGRATTYTAPFGLTSADPVTIIATSTYTTVAGQGPVVQQTSLVNVTPASNSGTNNGLLNGQYAFLLSGVNTTGFSALTGSIIADGNGNITGGEENLPGTALLYDGILGSYTIGSDGRGMMTLSSSSNSTNFLVATGDWLNGQQTFAIAVVDSTHVFVEEFDGTGTYNLKGNPVLGPSYGSTLRGELEAQTLGDFSIPPSGPFAFAWVHGGALVSPTPEAAYYGGVLDTDVSGNITSFWIDRYVDGVTGSITSGTYGPQAFGGLDTFGNCTVNLGPYTLNYFMISSGEFIVLASSSSDSTGLPAGHIYSQPSTTPSLAATYVFTLAGSSPAFSVNGASVVGDSPEAIGGWFTSDTSGNINGYLDTNNNGTVLSASVSGSLVPSVVSGSAVSGRWTLALGGGGASLFAVYPTVNYGLLMFQLDTRKSGTGTALLQASSPSFLGTYATSIQQLGIVNSLRNPETTGVPIGAWTDLSGQIVATSSSTLTGTLDIDQLNGLFLAPSGNFWMQTPGASVTGNFTTGAQERFTGSITTTQLGTMAGIFYVVDNSTVMFLEDDTTSAVGILQVQNF
jgi:hypothetical protein